MNIDSWLIVGGVTVNFYAALDWSQTYEPIGGSTVHRARNGRGVKQTHWRKLATRIQARGNIPPGLSGINWAIPQTMACASPDEISGSGLVYTIPVARRSDSGFAPLGYAYLARDAGWVSTPLALAGNVATLTAVSGATAYRVRWWPLLTILSDGPKLEQDLMPDDWSWTLEAEEQ